MDDLRYGYIQISTVWLTGDQTCSQDLSSNPTKVTQYTSSCSSCQGG